MTSLMVSLYSILPTLYEKLQVKCWWNWHMWSISSAFYARIFCTKVLCTAFFCLHVTKGKRPKKLSYKKGVHKMLMKLTPWVHLLWIVSGQSCSSSDRVFHETDSTKTHSISWKSSQGIEEAWSGNKISCVSKTFNKHGAKDLWRHI